MQKGKPRNTVKKGHDRGTRIEAVLICPPRLQRAAGDVKYRGHLTLGDTLGVQIGIPRKQVRAFEARPALVAIIIAT